MVSRPNYPQSLTPDDTLDLNAVDIYTGETENQPRQQNHPPQPPASNNPFGVSLASYSLPERLFWIILAILIIMVIVIISLYFSNIYRLH